MTEQNLKFKNKILVVDDDPVIEELLLVNLKNKNYNAESAKDGKEALQKIKLNRPDLIVLDIMVPEIDGWELCKIIRDDKEFSETKILMLTAKDNNRDKMIGKYIFKADEYVTKPFDIDNLIDIIDRLITYK